MRYSYYCSALEPLSRPLFVIYSTTVMITPTIFRKSLITQILLAISYHGCSPRLQRPNHQRNKLQATERIIVVDIYSTVRVVKRGVIELLPPFLP